MKVHRVLTTLTALVFLITAFVSIPACAQDDQAAATAEPAAATETAAATEETAAPPAEASTAVLESDEARESYVIGLQLGESIKKSGLEVDTAALFVAIEDALKGRAPALTQEEMMATMQALQGKMQKQQEKMQKQQEKMMQEMQSESEDNLKKAEEFLAKNAGEPNVMKTDSGLQYMVMKQGEGEKPVAASKVRVHYKGTLLDGTEFDSSYKRGEPAEFQVGGVIKGWQEALQLMSVGSQYKLFIPPDLAYGPQPRPGIPGNSLLIFEVELIEIVASAPETEQGVLIQ
ncbi:MAG: FKBP-type peptidyl-prolyl cis-trans isomerase [Candidatus Hydrogenedentes bacterium]|nr:FKBP-type peptidyl-prolyl cis-trans isomerase [Candidatus Hydrogenedentota bacterium]